GVRRLGGGGQRPRLLAAARRTARRRGRGVPLERRHVSRVGQRVRQPRGGIPEGREEGPGGGELSQGAGARSRQRECQAGAGEAEVTEATPAGARTQVSTTG